MNNLLPKSIRLNLMLLALLGALPVLAVVLLTGLRLRDQALEDAQAEAKRLVRTYADRQESVALGVKQLLMTLASVQEIRQLDAKACTKLFQKLVHENPNHANFTLVLPNGDAIASAHPFTKSNFSDLKHIIETKKTLDFAAGEYIKGRISGEPVIAFSYPVLGLQGELIAIIATSIRLDNYETLFKAAMMPEQSALVITDRNGIRIFVFPAREKYGFGERLSSKGMSAFYGESEEGYLHITAQDSVKRYYAFRQLRLPNQSTPYFVLAVGIPEAQVLAKADRVTETYLLWLAGALCLSLLFAWLVGEYGIARRLERFAALAKRVGEGDFTAMSEMAKEKCSFGIVARAFNDMVVALNTRETERARAEAALRKALEETHTIFEAMGHPVMVLNTSFEILQANTATEKALGISLDDIVGKKCHTLFHCTDAPPKGCPANDLLSRVNSGPVQMEQEAFGRIFLVYCTPVYDSAGMLDKIIHISTDITELKATQASLTAAKEIAEAANRAKSVFLANMSHEIRTPLNGVLGMLNLIKGHSVPSEVECYAEMATRSGRRLTSLLGDILDLSRIESGRMRIERQPFILADIFIALSETYSPIHMSKRLSFIINVGPNVPTDLLGDEIRVRQILFNLVGNAMKFTDKGEVKLEVSRLLTHPSGIARLLFVVSDTGPGIPEEKVNLICAPFTQVSEDLTRSHQGAGLGLSIAQHLVDAMGGTITFDSTVGHGTSVYLMLPFSVPEHASVQATPQQTQHEESTSSLRILLVEDEEISRLSARLNLEKMGHQVITASNGEEALEALRGSTYDCVLMDIQMDVMDGVETTRRIRNGSSGALDAQVPIIAMTAYAMTGDREKFLAAGMNDYVPKPISPSELKRALAQIAKQNGRVQNSQHAAEGQ